jgi:membrane-bound metal-dependent hydrolase YbcI (DUF457 family)
MALFGRLKENGRLPFFIIVLSGEILDILVGLFILLNLEGGTGFGSVDMNLFDLPWSHSLFMVIIWSILYAILAYFLIYLRNSSQIRIVSLLAGLGVFSHWVFDMLVHNNDMILDPFSDPEIILPALYIWQSPIVSFLLELSLIIAFWGYYFYEMKKQGKLNSNKIFLGLVLLLILHLGFYAPSFTNTAPVEIDPIIGIGGGLLILAVTLLLTVIHKNSTEYSS